IIMGILLKGKKDIESYISANGELDIRTVALGSLEYLLKEEKLSINDISKIFNEEVETVIELFERNGLL
ncbi:MAG: hypothetical protein K2N30_03760, partial [Clostridia bacterium]|nr:hypothetical protein [Clostridia bacterium]